MCIVFAQPKNKPPVHKGKKYFKTVSELAVSEAVKTILLFYCIYTIIKYFYFYDISTFEHFWYRFG